MGLMMICCGMTVWRSDVRSKCMEEEEEDADYEDGDSNTNW